MKAFIIDPKDKTITVTSIKKVTFLAECHKIYGEYPDYEEITPDLAVYYIQDSKDSSKFDLKTPKKHLKIKGKSIIIGHDSNGELQSAICDINKINKMVSWN